ncbi:putative membrane-associated kinase regulator 1 [Iris pallida]|uniref:Membrane-associated kinase regulator 1 n=1 Tax=Iris pallida TaxID=29817 RepID=A0AAX6DWN6_IRIPA|nr:putative membrane-associated kinase regulator 1 [Iris pallida]KAJ6846669.1 putative membrane-associated kinase regulator 1 [Iris pallida]
MKSVEKSREKRGGMRRTGSFPSPSSSSSSSSSDFEFTVSLSPSSRRSSNHLCPADELFYKGQLLPLHLTPRISMVRTLLLASSSTSSSSTDTTSTTTASRDSNGSSSSSASSAAADLLLLLPECDSSRPSSVTEEEARRAMFSSSSSSAAKRGKYFSSLANRFSSVFLNRGGSKKDASGSPAAMELDYQVPAPLPAGKRVNTTAKQVIKKYVNKVKPLYEKFSSSSSSQKNQSQNQKKKTFSFSIRRERDMTLMGNCSVVESTKKLDEEELEDHRAGGSSSIRGVFAQSHSFSGNLRYPRRKRCAGSCPSSMRSSPTHSGLLRMNGSRPGGPPADSPSPASSSSMEELQNAIQGAIAHCKSTISQSNLKNADSAGATTSSNNVTSLH